LGLISICLLVVNFVAPQCTGSKFANPRARQLFSPSDLDGLGITGTLDIDDEDAEILAIFPTPSPGLEGRCRSKLKVSNHHHVCTSSLSRIKLHCGLWP